MTDAMLVTESERKDIEASIWADLHDGIHRGYPRTIAAVERAIAAHVGTGRCGARAPEFKIDDRLVPAAFCNLPAGHRGWHHADNDSEWSP
jgi:hypothetical protein